METRQVSSLLDKCNILFNFKKPFDIITEFPHLLLVFLQYDRFDAGDLHRLLCRDCRSGIKFLCSASWFAGLQFIFVFSHWRSVKFNFHLWSPPVHSAKHICTTNTKVNGCSYVFKQWFNVKWVSNLQLSFKGDFWFPRAAAVCRVPVHCAASESSEKHDVLPAVLFCHGSHVLHPLHVYGEPTNTHLEHHNEVHANRAL